MLSDNMYQFFIFLKTSHTPCDSANAEIERLAYAKKQCPRFSPMIFTSTSPLKFVKVFEKQILDLEQK
jgi:hypothetical protein